MDVTLVFSGNWGGFGGITTTGLAVDAEIPGVASGSGVGVVLPSSEEILENLLVRA